MTWTEDQKATVRRLWARRYSFAVIADMTGLSRNAVAGWLDRQGLKRDGAPPAVRRPAPNAWPSERVGKVVALWGRGYSHRRIAVSLRIEPGRLSSWLYRHGYVRGQRKPAIIDRVAS